MRSRINARPRLRGLIKCLIVDPRLAILWVDPRLAILWPTAQSQGHPRMRKIGWDAMAMLVTLCKDLKIWDWVFGRCQ